MSVYGPQTGRTEAERQEFRGALERVVEMIELEVMMCICGGFNVHVRVVQLGEEECVRKFGWGTRNREV